MDLSKAKDASLIAKWVGLVIVLVCAVLKWLGIFPHCQISEVCTVAFTIMGLFGTVDINILADKFVNNKSERR